MSVQPSDVLDFWFGAPDSPEYGENRKVWFEKSDAFDAEIRARFGGAVERAIEGGFAEWQDTPLACLALIVLLDQFPRNLYRGQAKAFAGDPRALALAAQAVERGFDKQLLPVQRVFLYLPFEHSEDRANQERSVALFTPVSAETGYPGWVDYAVAHRDIVARFGRFPHRNAALGRDTTAEEAAFLTEPNSSF
ncbi:DUF924 family protein [Oceanibaculum pacificum]|uniref:DUF924 domain-containing protein n=1 Tax=Oceanibaculum pacificum TaxID=580166 RepID=A0A154VYJ1_9PROT|nr:DUF924 family protein [Oceanibaculum pacificum]KZD06412.1 hypothetical protein AUP43_10840 [Oceanibaculum pacificum]